MLTAVHPDTVKSAPSAAQTPNAIPPGLTKPPSHSTPVGAKVSPDREPPKFVKLYPSVVGAVQLSAAWRYSAWSFRIRSGK
eukprot:SAG31_NODE_425_length_15822_cov_10.580758_9_plen_81_part_00